MENGWFVFQADEVRVFSSAVLCCELDRRQVLQTAVRPAFVVVASPVSDDPSGFKQILEPAHTQTFLAQFPVEALHVTVLRRLARLRVNQVDLPLQIPCQKMPTR